MRRFCLAVLVAVATISISAGGVAASVTSVTSVPAAPTATAHALPGNLIW
jgi:hypothetical protein